MATRIDAEELDRRLTRFDFAAPIPIEDVLDDCVALLRKFNIHNTHPRYFGLFNPPSIFPAALAEILVAVFNPQLAVWSQAPVAVEIEQRLVGFLGARLGFDPSLIAGSFTSGGTEANLTGVLLALTRAFPTFANDGLRALSRQPLIYASEESHRALLKIAHQCGLGRRAVRLISVDDALKLNVGSLERLVSADRARGAQPFLVVATAGTTSAGVIDPLEELAALCQAQQLRLHVDAAWGGAAALSDSLRSHLGGIEQADSITVDAHKWLSVPMGGGIFICEDEVGLEQAFAVSATYMPAQAGGPADPYAHSVQWSRRFTGLKLFVSLAVLGREGYAAMLERQAELGEILRARAEQDGWEVVNQTPFPVVCLADPRFDALSEEVRARAYGDLASHVIDSGQAWVSMASLNGRPALRACITSFQTTEADLDILLAGLARAREHLMRS